jgi:hypothetical protein
MQFGVTPSGSPTNCTLAPLFTHVYIFVNLFWNVCFVTFLAKFGANANILVGTVLLPVNALIFAIPFIPNSRPVTAYTGSVILCFKSIRLRHVSAGGGLIVILFGVVVYQYWNKVRFC